MKILVLLISCLLVQSKTLHKRHINGGNFQQGFQQPNEIGDQRWIQQWPNNQRLMFVHPKPIQENLNWLHSDVSKSRNQRTIDREPNQEYSLAMFENYRQSLKNARHIYEQMRHDSKLAINPNIYVDNSKREAVTPSTTALPTATTQQVYLTARPENNSQIIPDSTVNVIPENIITNNPAAEPNLVNSTERTSTGKPSITDHPNSESESNESAKSIQENEVLSNSTSTKINLDPLHQFPTNTKSKSSRSIAADNVHTLDQVRTQINRYRQRVQFLQERKQDLRKFFNAQNLTGEDYNKFIDDLKQKGLLTEQSGRSLTSKDMLTNLTDIVSTEIIKQQQQEIKELEAIVDNLLPKTNRSEEEQTIHEEFQKLQTAFNDLMNDMPVPKQRSSMGDDKTTPTESKLDQLNRELHNLEMESRMRQHELLLEKLELQMQRLTPPKLLPPTNSRVEAFTSDLPKQPNLKTADERIAHLEQLIKHMTPSQGRSLTNEEHREKDLERFQKQTPKWRQGNLDKQQLLDDLLVNVLNGENAPHNLLVSDDEIKTNHVLSRPSKPHVFQLPFCLQPVNQLNLKPYNEPSKFEYAINQPQLPNMNPNPDAFKPIYRQSYPKEDIPLFADGLQFLQQKFGLRKKRSVNDETEENIIESVKQRLADLKTQLEFSNFPNESSFDFDPNSFRSAYDYLTPGMSPQQGYQVRKVQKFDDLFIKIIKFILHKLEISAPYIVQSLFNGDAYYYVKDFEPVTNGFTGYPDANTNYRKSEGNPTEKSASNEIQGTERSGLFQGFQGLLGFVPAVLLNLLSNFSSFLNVLKRNKFFKSFVVPGAAILVVDGVIALLVWWLSAPEDAQNSISLISDLLNNTFTQNFS